MDDQDTAPDQAPASPAIEAMRHAMRAAEEAARARAESKKHEQRDAGRDVDMLAELALLEQPFAPIDSANMQYALDEMLDVQSLIQEAAAIVPEPQNEERDGDLVLLKHEAQAAPWYQEAGEAALPAGLKGIAGPIDVKTLLTALMVEIGDVKRTNAILMEMVSRVEEKVDRVSRQMKDRRHF